MKHIPMKQSICPLTHTYEYRKGRNCMNKKGIVEKLRKGLIVSCQALPGEPLAGKGIMAKMAHAAELGGAVGIRANGREDIDDIKKTTNLPVIGIIKQEYEDSEVYITPTEQEVQVLAACGADIIAMDATGRKRPGGISLPDFFEKIRRQYPDLCFMADCSTFEEGVAAQKLGFDLVGTTLAGYTGYTKEKSLPDFEMIRKLSDTLDVPVIAEGGIWTPEELQHALDCGAYAAVVGTAITRPREITRRFCTAIL